MIKVTNGIFVKEAVAPTEQEQQAGQRIAGQTANSAGRLGNKVLGGRRGTNAVGKARQAYGLLANNSRKY